MPRLRTLSAAVCLVALTATACSGSKTEQGALVGGVLGATLGSVVGSRGGKTVLGAVLGAAIGGAAGAFIGHRMDDQAKDIAAEVPSARVERVGEGIRMTFQATPMFEQGKADLTPRAQADLTRLARSLNEYPDTNVLIEGHTDNEGSDAYNEELSERRAERVAHFLASQGVSRSRMSVIGYGEKQPIVDNDTATGRETNRRVEIAVVANEDLKAEARQRGGR